MVLEALQETVALIPWWLLVAVALLAGFIEATPVLGVLVPANSMVFLLGIHWAHLHRWPLDLVGAYAVGSLLGDILFFTAGRRYGIAFMERWPGLLRVSPQNRDGLERLVDAHGGKAVLVARFQPVTRSFAPYVAGAARMSAPRFLLVAAIASLAMACVVVAGGYLTGLGLRAVGRTIGWAAAAAVATFAVLAFVYIWLTRHLKLVSHVTLSLTLGAAMAAGGLAALVLGAASNQGWILREAAGWPRALALVEPFAPITDALAFAGQPLLLLLVGTAAAGAFAVRKRWRPATLLALAGPGLAVVLAGLQGWLPRAPPQPSTSFALAGFLEAGFPAAGAALALSLTMVALWLWPDWPPWTHRTVTVLTLLVVALLSGGALLAGRTWPTQTAAGLALGGLWACLLLLADIRFGRNRMAKAMELDEAKIDLALEK